MGVYMHQIAKIISKDRNITVPYTENIICDYIVSDRGGQINGKHVKAAGNVFAGARYRAAAFNDTTGKKGHQKNLG